MTAKITNVLLGIVAALMIFNMALQQQSAKRTQRMLRDVLDRPVAMNTPPNNQPQADPPTDIGDDSSPSPMPAPVDRSTDQPRPANTLPDRATRPMPDPPVPINNTPWPDPELADAAGSTDSSTQDPASTSPPPDNATADATDPGDGGAGQDSGAAAGDSLLPPPPPASDTRARKDWPTYGPRAIQVIDELLSGNYAAVLNKLDGDMARTLDRATLVRVMDPIRAKHGRLARILGYRTPDPAPESSKHAFEIQVATTEGDPLTFTITLDQRERVAGLWVK